MRLQYLLEILLKQLEGLEYFNHIQISDVIMKCKGIKSTKDISAIAAGLSMKLIVTFETATLESYADTLKIVTDG